MPDARREFGDRGEALAASFLKKKGMRILGAQVACRGGEIDLVCEDRDSLVFVEVKTRRTGLYGNPEDAVTPAKIARLLRAAHWFLTERHLEARLWRVDVVAIRFFENDTPPEIIHFENIDTPEELW